MRFLIIDDFGCIGTDTNHLPKQGVNEANGADPAEAVGSLLPARDELEIQHTNNTKIVRVANKSGTLLVTVVCLD